ncbi:MAG: hypothetical protein WCF84_19450 [Anaerolineae bacterium]
MPDIFYDLETRELLDLSLEDQTMAIRSLHFSVGVSWCECHKEQIFYRADALAEHLLAHERIIGFSIKRFDNAVLAYQPERSARDGAGKNLPESPDQLKALLDAPTFDLQLDLEMRLGYRLALQALAQGTLGREKNGSAPLAVIWYRLAARLKQQYAYSLREANDAEGASRVQELGAWFQNRLERYCAGDVTIARQLFEYGVANRRVAFIDFEGERRIVKVDWK